MYMFPYCEKFKDAIDEQVGKITEEVGEIEEALDAFRCNNNTETFESLGMEILDVIHACETLLRNIYDDVEVEDLRDKVIAKNEERGYYDALRYEPKFGDYVTYDRGNGEPPITGRYVKCDAERNTAYVCFSKTCQDSWCDLDRLMPKEPTKEDLAYQYGFNRFAESCKDYGVYPHCFGDCPQFYDEDREWWWR